jgi:cobalamin-dependent methionine synthase I
LSITFGPGLPGRIRPGGERAKIAELLQPGADPRPVLQGVSVQPEQSMDAISAHHPEAKSFTR